LYENGQLSAPGALLLSPNSPPGALPVEHVGGFTLMSHYMLVICACHHLLPPGKFWIDHCPVQSFYKFLAFISIAYEHCFFARVLNAKLQEKFYLSLHIWLSLSSTSDDKSSDNSKQSHI